MSKGLVMNRTSRRSIFRPGKHPCGKPSPRSGPPHPASAQQSSAPPCAGSCSSVLPLPFVQIVFGNGRIKGVGSKAQAHRHSQYLHTDSRDCSADTSRLPLGERSLRSTSAIESNYCECIRSSGTDCSIAGMECPGSNLQADPGGTPVSCWRSLPS
jgi:hypothetical protein